METDALEIVCFICIAIGFCLALWSAFAFKDMGKYRIKGKYPSVEIRDYSFLIFSSVIWSICSIIYPLFIYLVYIQYDIIFNFYTRLILYSFELFGILSLLIVKICKLYYNINKLIDDEKWFCCHIIDKYWLHSFYVINYELIGRSSYLLLFCFVYFAAGILIITFCSVKNNILWEYISLFIISLIPMILICYIFHNIRYNTKYFVDDHFLLQEIFISIIIYFIIITPPFLFIFITRFSNNNILLIHIIQIITNTISCSLLIVISLKFGVWAAIHREQIIKQERNKLPHYLPNNVKYERKKHLSAIDEIFSKEQLKSLQNEAESIASNSSDSIASPDIPIVHTHIDSMEKIFFKDLLNFRFGFYIFSEYLYNNKALNNLAFIAELQQFKKELNIQLSDHNHRQKKLIPKKYDWIKGIDLKFLPRGDCHYMASNQNNIVFQAWNIYKKYISKKIIKKNEQLNICITDNIVYKIGNILESIYQQYQFLYSQKKYYLKYKKNKNVVEKNNKYCKTAENIKKYEKNKNRKRIHKCYFNRYVSIGSFGNDSITMYGSDIRKMLSDSKSEESDESISMHSQSGSIPIDNIQIVSINNEYQSVPIEEDEIDYEMLDLEINDNNKNNENINISDPPFTIEPLNDYKQQRSESENENENDNNSNNDSDSEENDTEEPLFLQKKSDTKITDIWSIIENEQDTQINVEPSTLNELLTVFNDAEEMIWDKLLQYYETFKIEQSDEYLMCRYKLRSCPKDYIKQKNSQKIFTPRNRYDNSLPFWKKTKVKNKVNDNIVGSPFNSFDYNYDYTHVKDQIQIVDASEISSQI